jgi:hypothetical protein
MRWRPGLVTGHREIERQKGMRVPVIQAEQGPGEFPDDMVTVQPPTAAEVSREPGVLMAEQQRGSR